MSAYQMNQTFVNPLPMPEYPKSPKLRGGPFGEAPSGPFGMGPLVAKGLPPTHQRFQKLFGARAQLQTENATRSS